MNRIDFLNCNVRVLIVLYKIGRITLITIDYINYESALLAASCATLNGKRAFPVFA